MTLDKHKLDGIPQITSKILPVLARHPGLRLGSLPNRSAQGRIHGGDPGREPPGVTVV